MVQFLTLLSMNFLFTSTPLVFFSLLIYTLCIIFSLSFDRLESVWIIIEVSTFVFVGVSLILSQSSSSGMSLISYFLTQSVFSLILLVLGFSLRYDPNFTISVLLGMIVFFKLGAFPVHSWYFTAVMYLPNPSFLLSLTFQKILPLYVLTVAIHGVSYIISILFSFLLLINMIIAGTLSLTSLDLRSVVVFTSIANNIWLFSSVVVRFSTFLVFLAVYYSLLLLLFSPFSPFKTLSLVSLRGLPPFPMFFLKLFVVYGLASFLFFPGFYLLTLLLMLGTLLVSLSYIRLVIADVMVMPI